MPRMLCTLNGCLLLDIAPCRLLRAGGKDYRIVAHMAAPVGCRAWGVAGAAGKLVHTHMRVHGGPSCRRSLQPVQTAHAGQCCQLHSALAGRQQHTTHLP